MNLFFLHHSIKDLNGKPRERNFITSYEPEYESVEGSEFLDDGLRMKDQPLMIDTEEGAGAESTAGQL